MKVEEVIKILRKSRGLTQQELADKLGVKRQRVTTIESSGNSMTINSLIELTDIFNCVIKIESNDGEKFEIEGEKSSKYNVVSD